VRFGRSDRVLSKDFEKYYKKWKGKEITGVEFSKIMNASRTLIYRFIKEYEGEGK
jgi:hypothetical protein